MIPGSFLDRLDLWGVTLNGVYQPSVPGRGEAFAFPFLTVGPHKLALDNDAGVHGSIPPFPVQAEALLRHAIETVDTNKGPLLSSYTHMIQMPGVSPLPFTPEELDAEQLDGKGWRNYAVLTGYHQSYGCVWLDGWMMPVEPGTVWHIGQTFHNTIITNRNESFTVALEVRPFGIFERGGVEAAPVTITATCADLEQRHPLPGFDGVGSLADELVVTLHSIHPNGRQALLALYARASGTSLADCPVGWLMLTISGDEPGAMTATLSVYKGRVETLGAFEEQPLSPALSGDAVVVFAGTSFSEIDGEPDNILCTFSGQGEPVPPFELVSVQEYSHELLGRILNLAFRPSGDIAELTCDVTWAGTKTQAWSGVTSSGSVKGRQSGGGARIWFELVTPMNLSGTVSGESLVVGEIKFKADGAVVEHVEYRSHITRTSFVSTTKTEESNFDGSPDPTHPLGRHLNFGISTIGIAGASNSITATTNWETTLKVNDVTVDSSVRSSSATNGNAPASAQLTRPQSAAFSVREVYSKNSSELIANNRAWAVDSRPQTNHSQYVRWGNCNLSGTVQINDKSISSFSIAAREASPPGPVGANQLRDFNAHYDPFTESLVVSQIKPFLPESEMTLQLFYI